jgi:hypothetical protein
MADKKMLAVNFGYLKKKNCKPYFIVIMITVLIIIGIFWVVKLEIILSFSTTQTFTSGYLCTTALILFIRVGFLEYQSFK